MPASELKFKPGSLVRVRGREWVVEPNPDCLLLRPLGGGSDENQYIVPELEAEPVRPAVFPSPDITKPGPLYSARLLHDALMLKCRAGAGPFRGFGNIAIEPRPYQLVPLLMALKQKTIRLLIADDVGIGKTIEAALIARELLDRGEIERFSVLCPPHLVEQWVGELKNHFHIEAVPVTASNAARLERDTPRGESIFEYYTATVTSLDYIKSEEHRKYYLSCAPSLVIVDEAHTCTSLGVGKQQRFALLEALSKDSSRNLVMLTATPHSGNETGFANLLSLLNPKFRGLGMGSQDRKLREELGSYFVQRRRVDIDEWEAKEAKGKSIFPRRKTKEASYKLTGKWEAFFEKARSYCVDLAQKAEAKGGAEQHVIWYAVIALLRCVSSSPEAAKRALETRLAGKSEDLDLLDDDRILDGVSDDIVIDDSEPAALLEETDFLKKLISESDELKGLVNDPKLNLLVKELDGLLKDGYRPVIFCRYIATAHYVAEALKTYFAGKDEIVVDCVTGELSSDEREERINELKKNAGEKGKPILVATDCLSEGINLQDGFNAMVHYDLAWNPARHEQREGRIDRFGQKSKEVRCVMLYGENNPVDGLILNVIIKKAKIIRNALGILVPIPEDERKIQTAIVKSALLKPSSPSVVQGELNFGEGESSQSLKELSALTDGWEDAAEKEKRNRTIFAQNRLRPEEVWPEWEKQNQALGSDADTERFVTDSLWLLGDPLVPVMHDKEVLYEKFTPSLLSEALKANMENEGVFENEQRNAVLRLGFHEPPDTRAQFIHRSHPLVSVLADYMLESALSGTNDKAARCGVYETNNVDKATMIFLLRLRHKISMQKHGTAPKVTIAEEALYLGFRGKSKPERMEESLLRTLLSSEPSGNLSKNVIERELADTLRWYKDNMSIFGDIAAKRSAILLADHRRVRDAAGDIGSFAVEPGLPPDLIGVFVLLPASL